MSVKAPSSALSRPARGRADPDGTNRWVGVLALLVTRPSQTRSRDPGPRYPQPVEPDDASSCRADPGSRCGSSRPDISQDRAVPCRARHAHGAARGSRDGPAAGPAGRGRLGLPDANAGPAGRSVIHSAIWPVAVTVTVTDCNE